MKGFFLFASLLVHLAISTPVQPNDAHLKIIFDNGEVTVEGENIVKSFIAFNQRNGIFEFEFKNEHSIDAIKIFLANPSDLRSSSFLIERTPGADCKEALKRDNLVEDAQLRVSRCEGEFSQVRALTEDEKAIVAQTKSVLAGLRTKLKVTHQNGDQFKQTIQADLTSLDTIDISNDYIHAPANEQEVFIRAGYSWITLSGSNLVTNANFVVDGSGLNDNDCESELKNIKHFCRGLLKIRELTAKDRQTGGSKRSVRQEETDATEETDAETLAERLKKLLKQRLSELWSEV